MSRKKTGQGREKGLDTTHLITGHNVPEADAAERDETEVAAVQQAPLLPPAEQRGPEQNVPATKGNRVKAFRCLPFIGHRHLTGQQTDRQTSERCTGNGLTQPQTWPTTTMTIGMVAIK